MTARKLPAGLARRSDCPIATALDLLGDRWSLLLVRDIGLFGKHRNKDFQQGREAIPSNILAQRLKHLVATGLVEKRPYQARPPRYEYHLSRAGRDLVPILRQLALWSTRHIEGVRVPAELQTKPGDGQEGA